MQQDAPIKAMLTRFPSSASTILQYLFKD